jgi:serine/threonine-protein kinase
MPLQPGEKLGPYEILAPIGAGGMGEVWKARDPRLNRIVAIKRVKGQHTARFEQEARAIAALNHPHICQIYDVGPDYLVMEYVEGKPSSGPLPVAEAVKLALQIAGALVEAHAAGVLHRDLKPANILVTPKGSAKLLDFGLAKLTGTSGDDTTQTMEGAVMGTAAYMSPEQAQGKPLDARSDVFSFGAVLYEMVSGRRAFSADSMLETLNAVVRSEPAPLDSPASGVVKRCMAKDPAQRYQTMTEVCAALEPVSAKPATEAPSIAVLPFANMSADKEQEYFSDGLAEEIINALAQIPGLKVSARTSAFAFRGKEQDITEIAEALKVRTILEGSVRRAGSRVRITAQLINAADGYHLWSQRYDAEMTDVFAVQDEIADAIASALKVKLVKDTSGAVRHQPNLPAYEAFLKGRHFLLRNTQDAHGQAEAYLEKAIALDPEYAAPHAELAILYLVMGAWGVRPPLDVMTLANGEATKAFALAPDEPAVHMALGALAAAWNYNWEKAGEHFRRALSTETVPAEVRARYGLYYLLPLSRFAEAKEQIEKALEPDPLSVLWRSVLSIILSSMGRYEEAVVEGQKALEINRNAWMAHEWMSASYAALGRLEEARRSAEEVVRVAPWNYGAIGLLAGICERSGDHDRARQLLAQIPQDQRKPMAMVLYHLQRFDVDAVAHWFEAVIAQHDMIALLYQSSEECKPLRNSRHWPRLAKMMNLPQDS